MMLIGIKKKCNYGYRELGDRYNGRGIIFAMRSNGTDPSHSSVGSRRLRG